MMTLYDILKRPRGEFINAHETATRGSWLEIDLSGDSSMTGTTTEVVLLHTLTTYGNLLDGLQPCQTLWDLQ